MYTHLFGSRHDPHIPLQRELEKYGFSGTGSYVELDQVLLCRQQLCIGNATPDL